MSFMAYCFDAINGITELEKLSFFLCSLFNTKSIFVPDINAILLGNF